MAHKVSITLVGDDWQKAVAVIRDGQVLHLLHPIQGAQTVDLKPEVADGAQLAEVETGFDGAMVGGLPLSIELVDVEHTDIGIPTSAPANPPAPAVELSPDAPAA